MAEAPEHPAPDPNPVAEHPPRQYLRLLELMHEIASMLDIDELLQHIVLAAKELTGSAAASLLLYDPETHKLYFEAATDSMKEGMQQIAVPPEGSITGWVFSQGKPLLVDDTAQEARFYPEVDFITGAQTRSILGVPMIAKGETLGVIAAINKPTGYGDEDVSLLQTLAAQAAIAIQNTRLFQQSDLIAEMVHELRTPLAALNAAAHLLQRDGIQPEQHLKLVRAIQGEVNRLSQMTGNFLDLARLESGRVRFAHEPVHLGGLIEECLELIRHQAEAESVEMHTALESPIATVRGDRNLLKQVLLNLLTNAIKYNRPGGSVHIRLNRQGDFIKTEIGDTGRGISAEDLPQIFTRFFRVPDDEGFTVGTGLGLAIAKRIVETHRGEIQVSSELGAGSTFTILLPVGMPRERGD